ncbi:MAG: SCP2 sterol-binding domain-containing protein [Myxococcota bacterium]
MTTAKEIFETKIADRLAGKPDIAKQVNNTYQFDLTGEDSGTWHIDLTKESGHVGEGAIENPGVIITMAGSDFVDLVEGRLNGQMAFMQGKLKVKGDMSLALKLQQVLG